MSSAFTKDVDNGGAMPEVGERHVSSERNLVTHEGLAMMDSEIAFLQDAMGIAEAEGDREQIALNVRDLRYWSARRETAEVSVPDGQSDVVRFGMTVQLKAQDGKLVTWKITGEDEADVKHHKISHVSPMAVALFGKKQGETISLNGQEWKIVSLSSDAS